MNAREIKRTKEEYNLYLRNIFMNVAIVNELYPPGEAFRKVDPERYQRQFNEWVENNRQYECDECGGIHSTGEDAELCCHNHQCDECGDW
jgi:hypothetical protein